MSSVEFWDATPREFHNRLTGFLELRKDNERMEWERIRWQTSVLLSPHLKKPLSPKELLQFEWERSNAVETGELSDRQKLLILKWNRKIKSTHAEHSRTEH